MFGLGREKIFIQAWAATLNGKLVLKQSDQNHFGL